MALLFVVSIAKDWKSPKKKKKSRSPQPDDGKTPDIALEIILPLQLQAYERMVVFLERIRIQALLQRFSRPQTVREKETLLVKTIRSEFDHNVSQQIYVSPEAWEAVTSAKEQTIHLIHVTASKFSPEEESGDFNRELLYAPMQGKKFPVRTALEVLNAESKKLLAQR